jgi:hypothetical protein
LRSIGELTEIPMSQKGMSEREYARHMGRSRGSVQKLRAAGRLVFHADGSIEGALTYLQARTANEVLKAQERRLRLQKLKGEVVDRARATALVFRLARQERDAWLGWPARIAATMAAELGVGAHELQASLSEHVRAHLHELCEIAADFR